MRRWKPQPTTSRWILVALLTLSLVLLGFVLSRLVAIFRGPPEQWVIDLSLFGWMTLLLALGFVAAALAYRTAATFTLGYELDRNGLYITWLGNRAVIPLDQISSLDLGVRLEALPPLALGGLGYYWGQTTDETGRVVQLFTTEAPERCLIVHTAEASYAISPADREAFAQDLEQRRNLGATKPLASMIEPSRMFLYSFWKDATIRGLLLGSLAINLLTLAILCVRYPDLAVELAMRFDATGAVVDMRPRYQTLSIPLAAFGLTLVNTALGIALYTRQQLSARLLQGASLTVQVLFIIGLLTVIR
ncbi:MAG: PH domain-containing protein [Roseiflexaceae bacterium]